jgi:hypothetical protein
MRDLIPTVMTAQGSAAICFALAGPATTRSAYVAGICMGRAHGILVTGRMRVNKGHSVHLGMPGLHQTCAGRAASTLSSVIG